MKRRPVKKDQIVKLKKTVKHPQFELGGEEYRIEGYWDEIFGKSWNEMAENNAACYVYSVRAIQNRLPLDQEVLYGKNHGLGHLIHVSEIEWEDEVERDVTESEDVEEEQVKALTLEEINAIDLPKWPGIVVVGENVTKLQAEEIILRTTEFGMMCSNDKDFVRQVHQCLNIEDNYQSQKDFMKKIKAINLTYLNNDRIVTSYVGGPNGWVDWDGTIGLANKNIGKYPTTEAVLNDLASIASAFPYLNMTVQLFDGEHSSEEPPNPVIQYDVRRGMVRASVPTKVIAPLSTEDVFASFIDKMKDPCRERGCTIHQLDAAYKNLLSKEK